MIEFLEQENWDLRNDNAKLENKNRELQTKAAKADELEKRVEELESALGKYADESKWTRDSAGSPYGEICFLGIEFRTQQGYEIAQAVLEKPNER